MSKSFVLADSGSTKTQWVIVRDGMARNEFVSSGMNPYVNSEENLSEVYRQEVLPQLMGAPGIPVYFYGAGCTEQENIEKMKRAMNEDNERPFFIGHDLLAAGRALLGKEKGIACILGTGSSSALFDEGEIQDQVPALGYILGDEGAGADLGKRLMVGILKRDAPAEIIAAFVDKYEIGKKEVLEAVFFGDRPNKFLASFAPFLLDHQDEPYIKSLIYDSIFTFFKLNVLKYQGCKDVPICFTGSVAHHFRDVVSEVADDCKLSLGKIEQSPMEGLIQYHTRLLS